MAYETYIAGVKFRRGAEAALEAAERPATLRMDREPTNKFDPNAIQLWLGDAHVGYVPAEDAAYIAPRLDRGEEHVCTLIAGKRTGIMIMRKEETDG